MSSPAEKSQLQFPSQLTPEQFQQLMQLAVQRFQQIDPQQLEPGNTDAQTQYEAMRRLLETARQSQASNPHFAAIQAQKVADMAPAVRPPTPQEQMPLVNLLAPLLRFKK